jgi:hypothetical protein
MYQVDFDPFRALMEELCAAHDRPLTDARVKVFWEALVDVPFPQVRAAIKGHIKKGGKFPQPAELRPKDVPAREYKGVDHAKLYAFVSQRYPDAVRPGRYHGFEFKTDESGNRETLAFVAFAWNGLPEIRITVAEMMSAEGC